jgi:hypothetical protein
MRCDLALTFIPVFLNWEAYYPKLFQNRLPSLCSDHFPILLDCQGVQGGTINFKFENMWLKAEGFFGQGETVVDLLLFSRSLSFILAHKHKALKVDFIF